MTTTVRNALLEANGSGQLRFFDTHGATITGLPQLGDFSKQLDEQITSMLDVSLSDIIAGAWKKLPALRECLQAPPGETRLVTLSEHSIESKHRPQLVIRWPGGERAIEFELKLSLQLEALHLHIRSRRIIGASAGQWSAAAAFRCTDPDVMLLNKQTQKYPLAGSVDFAAGIPLD